MCDISFFFSCPSFLVILPGLVYTDGMANVQDFECMIDTGIGSVDSTSFGFSCYNKHELSFWIYIPVTLMRAVYMTRRNRHALALAFDC